MLYPCIKCYRYSNEELIIKIGDTVIAERICSSCKLSMQDDLENLIMNWTLEYYSENIIYHKKSSYNNIYVTENDNLRYLRFFTALQSGIYKHTKETPASYLYSFLLGPIFSGKVEKILCIGLGSGYLVSLFRRYFPKSKIDVVEIDLEVYNVAKEYFEFKEDKGINVHIMDAKDYILESNQKKYDIVVLDAYDGPHIPNHLNQIDVYQSIKHILTEEGVLLGNLHGRITGEYSIDLKNTFNKMNEVFPYCVLIPSSNAWEMNILSISSKNLDLKKFRELPTFYPDETNTLIIPWINSTVYYEKDLKEIKAQSHN